jgi:hypothetical protein
MGARIPHLSPSRSWKHELMGLIELPTCMRSTVHMHKHPYTRYVLLLFPLVGTPADI